MHVQVLSENLRDRFEIKLPPLSPDGEEFAATGKKFGRSTFVSMDMRPIMTDRALERAANLGQGESIGSRAVKNNEGLAIYLENFAKLFAKAASPTISGVGAFRCVVGLEQRAFGFGADASGVVACKFVARRDRHSVP